MVLACYAKSDNLNYQHDKHSEASNKLRCPKHTVFVACMWRHCNLKLSPIEKDRDCGIEAAGWDAASPLDCGGICSSLSESEVAARGGMESVSDSDSETGRSAGIWSSPVGRESVLLLGVMAILFMTSKQAEQAI